jgi:hypothetical protein
LPWPAWMSALPAVSMMTGLQHHTQFISVEMESHNVFCLGWLGTGIFLMLASYAAWDDRHVLLHSAIG